MIICTGRKQISELLKRLNELIKDTRRTPFEGKGKPEPQT
ncbi:type II toxin-antitoxin system YoeB family toxin [Escherichia coli]